jgi:hypothetical protein
MDQVRFSRKETVNDTSNTKQLDKIKAGRADGWTCDTTDVG